MYLPAWRVQRCRWSGPRRSPKNAHQLRMRSSNLPIRLTPRGTLSAITTVSPCTRQLLALDRTRSLCTDQPCNGLSSALFGSRRKLTYESLLTVSKNDQLMRSSSRRWLVRWRSDKKRAEERFSGVLTVGGQLQYAPRMQSTWVVEGGYSESTQTPYVVGVILQRSR